MNEIHQLDKREQKSPQYLENIPNLIHENLEVGDYLSVSMIIGHAAEDIPVGSTNGLISLCEPYRKGHLVENKFEDFDIQSTDTLDQFRKELSAMCEWGKENPHVVLHAAWVKKGLWKNPYRIKEDGTRINVIKAFNSMCAEYDVWPHIYETGEDLLKFYKKLDQPSAYQKGRIYIPRDRTKITLRAKKFRQHPRISSEIAVKLDKELTEVHHIVSEAQMVMEIDGKMILNVCTLEAIHFVIGRKKNGKPKKLAIDLIDHLENGPKKPPKPPVFPDFLE